MVGEVSPLGCVCSGKKGAGSSGERKAEVTTWAQEGGDGEGRGVLPRGVALTP